jgi:DUF4097 and DUF4098 domain-containing protein YvlB
MIHPYRTLAAMLLLLFVANGSTAQDLSVPIERNFAVSAGGELNVDLDRGSISVETSNRNEIDVRIEREGSDEFLERMKFNVEETSNGVTVRGDYDGNTSWWRSGNRNRVHVQVTIPSRYNVVLETSGGSIEVSDLEGSVRTTTSGGSLRFGSIDGPIHGRTSGGSIELEGSTGTADVRTSGGSIRIGNVDGFVMARTSGGSVSIDRAGGEVDASTSGGGITVNEVNGTIRAKTSGGSIKAYISQQPKGDCTLTTSGGGVQVRLAPDVRVDVQASSSGGRVRTAVPITVVGEISRNRVTGTLNGGGPLLKLHTSGGGVSIETAD